MRTEGWIEEFHDDLIVETTLIACGCDVDHRRIMMIVGSIRSEILGPIAYEYPNFAFARLREEQALMVIEKLESTKHVLRFKHDLLKAFRRAREALGKEKGEIRHAELEGSFRARLNAIRKQRPRSTAESEYGEAVAFLIEDWLNFLKLDRGGKPLSARHILLLVKASENLIEVQRRFEAQTHMGRWRRWRRFAKRRSRCDRGAIRRIPELKEATQ
jgi:hypothetical protein